MPFVKVVKNGPYFKRFQVKYRRRREGKTDYRARRLMVLQDKTKYNAPKYRLVVRITNRDVVAQIVHAKVAGDDILMAAYSHELPAFGITLGLTNYAAAYATGLLVARRTLTKLGIASQFAGTANVTGEYISTPDKGDSEERYPFKAILDVGLARTTTGARVFAVMKGAVDGGLAIPHKPSRFPGFDKEKQQLDAKIHRQHIFGQHVADYMRAIPTLQEQNPDAGITQFSRFSAAGIAPDQLEAMYKNAHEAIMNNPMAKAPKKPKKCTGEKPAGSSDKKKRYRIKRLTYRERTEASNRKVAALRTSLAAKK